MINDAHKQQRPDIETVALIHLQRDLAALRGTWLARASTLLGSVAGVVGASAVSLYAAEWTVGETPQPTAAFTLVLSHHAANGAGRTASTSSIQGDIGAAWASGLLRSSPALGHEVRLHEAGPNGGPALTPVHAGQAARGLCNGSPACAGPVSESACTDRALGVAGEQQEPPEAVPALKWRDVEAARMLGLMLETQAAVLSAQHDSTTAVVPLITEGRTVGALWIVRDRQTAAATPADRGAGATAGGAASGSTGSASGTADAAVLISPKEDGVGATPASAAAAPAAAAAAPPPRACPALLANPAMLELLGAAVSSALLSGDGAEQLADLRGSVRFLAAAGSVQHLTGGLCGALSRHVRRRFLLDPRVDLALVPEPASPTALLFGLDADPAEAAVAAAVATAVAAPPPPPLPARERSALLRRAVATASASQAQAQHEFGSSSGGRPLYGKTSQAAAAANGATATAVAPREPSLLAEEPRAPSNGALLSALGTDFVAQPGQHQNAAILLSALPSGQCPCFSPLQHIQGPPSPTISRTNSARRAGAAVPPATLAEGEFMSALLDTDTAEGSGFARWPGGGGGGSSLGGGGAGGGGGSCWSVLRVKPFPLSHTLLRRVLGDARSVLNGAGYQPGGSAAALPPPSTAAAAAPARVRVGSLIVDDCTAHVQDPCSPAQDLLMLLSNATGSTSGPDNGGADGGGALPDEAAAAAAEGGGGGGSGTATARRGVGSLLLLALPTGDGRSALALYVAFPKPLPRPLLRRVRGSLVEMLQVLSPLLTDKLTRELSPELAALCTAAPGSFAVVDPSAAYGSTLVGAGGGGATGGGSNAGGGPSSLFLSSAPSHVILSGSSAQQQPHHPAPGPGQGQGQWQQTHGSVQGQGQGHAPGQDGSSSLSSVRGSMRARSFRAPGQARRSSWLSGRTTRGYSVGASAGASAGESNRDSMREREVLRRALAATAAAATPHGVSPSSLTLSLSGVQQRLPGAAGAVWPSSGSASGGPRACRSRSTSVIVVDELDTAQCGLRVQVPLLVASMQSSINAARHEASMTSAAAASGGSGSRPVGLATAPSYPPLCTSAGGGVGCPDAYDLSVLELHTRLGVGGCAVVFKGRFGSVDCAVKVMEMPDAEGQGAADGLGPEGHWRGGAQGQMGQAQQAQQAQAQALAARRTLLRNAMEAAALLSLSHPNIIQVFSTFNNVVLAARVAHDGGKRLTLRPAEAAAADPEQAPQQPQQQPVCMAIVCEWCDRGCVATALAKRSLFHRTVSFEVVSVGGGGGGGGGGAGGAGTDGGSGITSQPQRILDYKAVVMTLLDVAMALRYLHSRNLVHRDIKAANVLLKSCPTDPRGFTAKLADFGFVTILNQPGDARNGHEPYALVDQSCGTVTHMAPECMRKPYRLDASCDVFSFGILMWEMTADGSRPYREIRVEGIPRAVYTGTRANFSSSVPLTYRLLAQRCWASSPNMRPRASDLVIALSQMLG